MAKWQQSLSKIFIKHLLALAAGAVILVILYYYVCFGMGLFQYANYAEHYLQENGFKIAQVFRLMKRLSLIPADTVYMIAAAITCRGI